MNDIEISGSRDPLARLHDKQFGKVLEAFTDFLRLLPQPVVLILDTCEELAKLRSDEEVLPAVEATFEILERLHEQIGGRGVRRAPSARQIGPRLEAVGRRGRRGLPQAARGQGIPQAARDEGVRRLRGRAVSAWHLAKPVRCTP